MSGTMVKRGRAEYIWMIAQVIDMTRVWAMVTGLALAVWYFAAIYLSAPLSGLVPMLVSAIAGFEAMLFGHDLWSKRKHGHG